MRLRMALLAMAFLTFGNSPQAKAPAAAAQRKGGAMTQRVLYSPMPVSDAVRDSKPEFLGKVAQGAWFALDDAAALRLRKDDSSVTMLYPNREEYDLAVEGLNEAQVQEAIAWRHKVWTPRVAPELMGDLFEVEKPFLARLARASVRPGPEGAAFKAAYAGELDLLDHLLYIDRNQGWETKTLIQSAFESLNNARQNALSLALSAPDKSVFPSPELAAQRKALALEADQTLKKKYGLYKDLEPSGEVFLPIQRGVYVTPNLPKVVAGIHASHEPVQVWRDGFVMLWSEGDPWAAALEGHKISFLYLSAAECQSDFSRLTEAQRAVKFGRLQKAMGTDAYVDEIASDQLNVQLSLRDLSKALAKKEPEFSAHLAKQADIEAESLRLYLAVHPAWGARGAAEEPAAVLAAAEKGSAEIAFWRDWTAVSRWGEETDEVPKISALKDSLTRALKQSADGMK